VDLFAFPVLDEDGLEEDGIWSDWVVVGDPPAPPALLRVSPSPIVDVCMYM
jgi:hypothetical protein